MRKALVWTLLALIILGGLAARLATVGGTFDTDTSYFHLRWIEQISTTGKFSYYDTLSYGGRPYYYPPFFYGFMALATRLTGQGARYIPLLFAALLPLIVFLLIRHFKAGDWAALAGGAITATVPVLFTYLNFTIEPVSFALPLFFLCLYAFLRVRSDSRVVNWYLALFILFTLTSAFSLLYVLTLFIYLILTRIEGKRIAKKELELFLFSLFFSSWFYSLVYQKLLLSEGFGILWRNIPASLFASVFKDFTLATLLPSIGVLVFLVGIYMWYKTVFSYNEKGFFLLASGILLILVGMVTKVLTPLEGLLFGGVYFAVLSGIFLAKLREKIMTTKFGKYASWIAVAAFLVIMATNVVAIQYALANRTVPLTASEERAFSLMREFSKGQSTVFAPWFYGNAITYFAGHKDVMDDVFLGITDADMRLADIREAYTTPFETEALQIFSKYQAKYLVVSDRILAAYRISGVSYVNDKNCFRPEFEYHGVEVYQITCTLENYRTG